MKSTTYISIQAYSMDSLDFGCNFSRKGNSLWIGNDYPCTMLSSSTCYWLPKAINSNDLLSSPTCTHKCTKEVSHTHSTPPPTISITLSLIIIYYGNDGTNDKISEPTAHIWIISTSNRSQTPIHLVLLFSNHINSPS